MTGTKRKDDMEVRHYAILLLRVANVPKLKCPSKKGAPDYPRSPQDTTCSLYCNVYQVHCNRMYYKVCHLFNIS